MKSATEVMVCDVARDRVRKVVGGRLGSLVRFETVPGEGTRVTCLAPDRSDEFQRSVREALAEVDGES
ncbi:MAG TPA: hypothetical protein VKY90_09900 [Candidatus Dormibacteraeota bacterium]|nr:hypothetical protein [Candidatus Dormibacteraeota bacterium]